MLVIEKTTSLGFYLVNGFNWVGADLHHPLKCGRAIDSTVTSSPRVNLPGGARIGIVITTGEQNHFANPC